MRCQKTQHFYETDGHTHVHPYVYITLVKANNTVFLLLVLFQNVFIGFYFYRLHVLFHVRPIKMPPSKY